MLRIGYSAPPQTSPCRHFGAARLRRLARDSIVPQCLLAVDATGYIFNFIIVTLNKCIREVFSATGERNTR